MMERKHRKSPQTIDISVTIKKISNIDCRKKTCFINFILEAAWNDPSVAGVHDDHEVQSTLDPQLEVINAVDIRELSHKAFVLGYLSGRMLRKSEHVGRIFMQKMSLSRFPFDEQCLEIIVRSRKYSASKFLLHLAEGKMLADASLPSEWRFLGIASKQKRTTKSSHSMFDASSLHILIGIQRESDYYVAQGMIPAFVLTCVSLTTYGLRSPENYTFRLHCIFWTLFFTISLKRIVVSSLKLAGSNTMMDTYVNVSLGCQAVALFATSFVEKYEFENEDTSRRLNVTFFLVELAVLVFYHFALARACWKYNTDQQKRWLNVL